MPEMAVAAKRLDMKVGDLIEVDGRRYDVVADKNGGLTLEPAITVSSRELHERHGTRPATPEEFDRHFGEVRSRVVPNVNGENLRAVLDEHVDPGCRKTAGL